MGRIIHIVASMFRKLAKRQYDIHLKVEYIRPDERYSNKRVVVTGGSGGIGLAMAKAFAAEGAKVLICARNKEKLERIIAENSQCSFIGLEWDVTKVEAIGLKIEQAELSLGGSVDIFLNCAGVATDTEIYKTEQDYDFALNVNQKALYFLTEQEAEYFVRRNVRGKIVNVTSRCSRTIWCDPYILSKWGAECITRGFARKYCSRGIAINGIAPGPVLTNIAERIRTKLERGDMSYENAGTKRTTTPEECAQLALYLCSSAASNVIGQNIVIDGGIYF